MPKEKSEDLDFNESGIRAYLIDHPEQAIYIEPDSAGGLITSPEVAEALANFLLKCAAEMRKNQLT